MTDEPVADPDGGGDLPPPPDVLFCTWHPDRETGLRCLRCDRPMCVECARRHPVGMRCKECARELRSPVYKVEGTSALIAVVAAGVGGIVFGVVTFVAVFAFGFFGILVGFFLGGIFGGLQAELVSRASGRKRGRVLQRVALGGLAVGALLPLALVGAGIVAAVTKGQFGAAAPTLPLLAGAVAYLVGAAATIRSRLA